VGFDFIGLFGDGSQQGMLVNFMQLIGFINICADATGNYQHRDTIEERFADTAGCMGNPGCRNDQQGADVIGCPANRVSHKCSAALMGDQNRPDQIRFIEFIIYFGVVDTRNTEGVSDAYLLKGVAYQPCACFFHWFSPGFVTGSGADRLWSARPYVRSKYSWR